MGAGAGATVRHSPRHESRDEGGLGQRVRATAERRRRRGAGGGRTRSATSSIPRRGRPLAGLRTEDGKALRGTLAALLAGKSRDAAAPGENTAIGVVATNVALTKSEATPRGADGPRRPGARDPARAHAVWTATRSSRSRRAPSGSSNAALARRLARGRGRGSRRGPRRAHGHGPAGPAVGCRSRPQLKARGITTCGKAPRRCCGFPVDDVCKSRRHRVETLRVSCGENGGRLWKIGASRWKNGASAAETVWESSGKSALELWTTCGRPAVTPCDGLRTASCCRGVAFGSGAIFAAAFLAWAWLAQPGGGRGRARRWEGSPDTRRWRASRWFTREPWTRWEWLALGAFALVSLRQFGWLVFERDGALLTLLPHNYGDLPLHWTYVQYLASGARFWPENPILTQRSAALPARRRSADGGRSCSSARGCEIVLPAMGLGGAALAALALRRWGGAFAVAGFLFAGGLAGWAAAAPAAPRGRRRAGRVEEPVPRAVRAAARLPARAARGPRPALELARPLLRGEPAPLPAWTERAALGRPAARPPPHVRVRLGDRRRLGDRERTLARGPARPGRRAAAGHLGRAAGDRRLPAPRGSSAGRPAG